LKKLGETPTTTTKKSRISPHYMVGYGNGEEVITIYIT
jgi:hypothetical protein